MRNSYSFEGRFKVSVTKEVTGSLNVYITEDSITVHPPERQGAALQIAPFCGGMFFGPWEHRLVSDVFERGYEISLSGTDLGQFATGGGPDGEFNIWKLKHAQIRGVFDSSGLNVIVDASTWPGSAVCYGAGERRENMFEPMELAVRFIVRPKDLIEFMRLRITLDNEVFSRFKWDGRNAP